MMIAFTKMHGLGNDFMVIDGTQKPIQLSTSQIAALARRDTGVGFDQCLWVERSDRPDVDFFYRIFNANGQEVGQCGNGARCLARFIQRQQLTTQSTFSIQTPTTKLTVTLHSNHEVSVDCGIPQLNPAQIPFLATEEAIWYTLTKDAHTYTFHAIGLGNPHAVLIVDDLDHTDVASLGKDLCEHPAFPEQTNVGFAQIINPHEIKLRVYERGCGETTACGSGAVAAMAVGRLYHHLAPEVNVHLQGGDLWVTWADIHQSIVLRGPATFVYDGILLEED